MNTTRTMSLVPATLLVNGMQNEAGQPLSEKKDGELKKACQDFEAMFINMILKEMRKSVPKQGMLHGGMQEEMYVSMFDQKMAEKIASGRGIGLWQNLYEELAGKVLHRPENSVIKGGANNGR